MTQFCLSCLESRITTPRNVYATYKLGPFEQKDTLTIANNLRRALLSEIPGIAITAAKIQGASHEYMALQGCRESVLEILLNLKQLALMGSFELTTPCIAYVNVTGPKVVRASDLQLPPFLKCVDPDQYITTLASDGSLNAAFLICPGKNYWCQFSPEQLAQYCSSPLSSQKETLSFMKTGQAQEDEMSITSFFQPDETPILPIDAVFMPIKKVNYSIETDAEIDTERPMDHIFLQIWTNGTLHPRDAIRKAAKTLVTLFQSFESRLQYLCYLPPDRVFLAKTSHENQTQDDLPYEGQAPFGLNPKLDLDIGNLELSLRPYSCLKRANIETIFDLLKYSREELLLLKNFGKRSLEEVETALFQMGLELPVKKLKRTK